MTHITNIGLECDEVVVCSNLKKRVHCNFWASYKILNQGKVMLV